MTILKKLYHALQTTSLAWHYEESKISSLYIYSCFIPRGIKQEYIYSDDIEETLPCLAREVFPGRGFSWGALNARKWGSEMFWGKCLKRNLDY